MLRQIFLFLAFISVLLITISCGRTNNGAVTVALSDKFSGLDTISTTTPDAAADRIRNLMFNSLVKKNEKFEYVGELGDFKVSEDGLAITFTLKENIKFHNGKPLTSADAKYTFDALFQANGYKAGSFFDTVDGKKEQHFTAIETPDAKTITFKVRRPALINQTLSNFVAIPIIPEGSVEQQKATPVGTGPFKFVKFDQANNIVELAANPEYFEGSPKIQLLNIKTVTDANALQAELQANRIDLAPNPTNISADTFNNLEKMPNLQIVKSDGSNVRYIGFNVSQAPVNNVKLRQAMAYAIDREKIIKELLSGQAKIAHSILPESSWAYSANVKYSFDQAKAKQLVQESGYKGEVVKFKVSAGNQAVSQYTQVIQESLKAVGINAELETLELNTLLDQLKLGQFQLTTSHWAGGNHDPIFLRDLFATNESPDKKAGGRNRSRYSNAEFDKVVQEAVDLTVTNKAKAKELYNKSQDIVANELPYITLWFPSNMVIASKRVSNININASGDWTFIKDVVIQ
ncbi:MAG: ABC transporter substrate-binding protein [Pyrinomonadaceae bacterium]|nr:ABC transporter substrate-binding protein [Pyrinomonadaceae bacterium]